jgi:hypothetical protein
MDDGVRRLEMKDWYGNHLPKLEYIGDEFKIPPFNVSSLHEKLLDQFSSRGKAMRKLYNDKMLLKKEIAKFKRKEGEEEEGEEITIDKGISKSIDDYE